MSVDARFRLSDEDEYRSMLGLFFRSTAHSFSKRNGGEVYLPHHEWLCTLYLVPPHIFIVLPRMNGAASVCCHSGVVVVVLPIVWTTVDRFFFGCVGRFLVGTIDRCGCVNFDRRRVFCLILSSTVACCDESWIIDSCGGRRGFLTGIGL